MGAIMTPEAFEHRLSRISTMWSMLHQAHKGSADAAAAAQRALLQRYGGAVHRYLLAIVQDTHAADDLTQEFGLSLIKGAFHKADPQRGRFRDYVKTALRHLVAHHRKQQTGGVQFLAPDSLELTNLASGEEEVDRRFDESWREELLVRAWEALAEAQPVFYSVLRFRAAHPELRAAQLASELSRQLGKTFSAAAIRQNLHRARDRFAELLIEEVAESLDCPTADQIAQELGELNLLAYCQPVLARYSSGASTRGSGPSAEG
jgi:RNA polymerase sigma-70 factor (ECF subfamily)